MALNERDDMTVVGAAEQIAFPMTWNGSVFDVRWTLPNRDGIGDLSTLLRVRIGLDRAP